MATFVDRAECVTVRAIVSGVDDDGFVDLIVDAASRCEGCAGACVWRRLPAELHTRVPGRATVTVGTPVLIALPQRYVLLAAVVLHGLPWLALLAGAAAGAYFTRQDLGALAGALLATALAIVMTPGLRRRLERAALERFTLQPIA